MTAGTGISLDSSLAPELVEFWGLKYKETKEELEKLKAEKSKQADDAVAKERAKLAELVESLKKESETRQAVDQELRKTIAIAQKVETNTREKLAALENDRNDLVARLAKSETNCANLTQQVQTIYSQAAALAAEADKSRREALSTMFPPVSFVDKSFVPGILSFVDVQVMISTLPTELSENNRLYFLPRPPSCMPLRVPACGQAGYWFYPSWILPEDSKFDLIVEGRPGEWSYLGCYVSAPFPEGHEMKLSEWMCLDEQTKAIHCARVASQSLPASQTASYATQIDVKRRYEVGEFSVPCYSLRCVGFSTELYQALHSAANKLRGGSASASTSVPGKRRRSIAADSKASLTDEGLGKRPRPASSRPNTTQPNTSITTSPDE